MDKERISPLYKFIKWLVRLVYPKTEIVGSKNLPEDPCVIVGNHTQMNGPIVSELYIPRRHYTWCASEMMELREVPAYAYRDFWSGKPTWCRWFYRLLSYVIAPVSVCVFNNAETIPVYHDTRIIGTFRRSVSALTDGADLVIFPEHGVPCNSILYDFQDKFIDVARYYGKKTDKALSFVPMYVAPALKAAYLGTPIRFDPNAPVADERRRIKEYLMTEITAMAVALPEHTVVPYLNLPRSAYPKNTNCEEPAYEAEEARR